MRLARVTTGQGFELHRIGPIKVPASPYATRHRARYIADGNSQKTLLAQDHQFDRDIDETSFGAAVTGLIASTNLANPSEVGGLRVTAQRRTTQRRK